MAPRSNSILDMYNDLETAFKIYLQAGTDKAATERGIDRIRIHILPAYSFHYHQMGENRDMRASYVRLVLHVILALMLLREAELHRSQFDGLQELSQFIASGWVLLDCCAVTTHI